MLLKDLKELYPCETADFSKALGIAYKLAFAWWVLYSLRKRNIILSNIRARIRKTTHKYEIKLLTSVKHSIEIDNNNGNILWKDSLAKEMKEFGVSFEVQEEGLVEPIVWYNITGHLIWYLKMDFAQDARWVLNGKK